MTKQPAYEEALALATTLPLEQLAQLVVVLNELLQKRYGTWTALQGVDEVRDYLEWTRFRDSHYTDGRRKDPQAFLTEVGEFESGVGLNPDKGNMGIILQGQTYD